MTDQTVETQLSVSEGVLLAHALVARVADSVGVRAFFIKGPASVMQGLRPPKTSADVDVFVHPPSLKLMLEGLKQRGWRERPSDPDSRSYPRHSVTLDHPEWPCCIDVHFRFPGMETDPTDCFDVLWAHTGKLDLAGHRIQVPSIELQALTVALHALRSPHLPSNQQELEFLTLLAKERSFESSILHLAAATGSLAATRPFLENLLPPATLRHCPRPSTEWRARLIAKEPGSARVIALLQASWRDKPKIIWRSVFPPPEAFLAANIYGDMSMRGRLRQQRSRWVRFARLAPRIVRDITSSELASRKGQHDRWTHQG